MAKTTKRRGATPPRGPQQRPATVPKAAPATPGGPNRQARKDEARRQREALHRKAVRRRVFRIAAVATAVVVVGASVAVFVVTRPTPAKAAGCASFQAVPAYPNGLDRAHIGASGGPKTMPALATYPSTPPASGPHNPTPLRAGVYTQPPPIDQAIHSLEHGTVEIWYPPSAAESAGIAKIRQFYGQPVNQDHIIVGQYSYPTQGSAGVLPAHESMVLVAWHVMQTCQKPSLAVAQDFVKKYRTPTGFNAQNPGAYIGSAPEAGGAI